MREIIDVLIAYKGTGILLFIYAVSLIVLLILEKDKVLRTLFVYLPLTILVLFMLPPVYYIYSKIETATYYRVLWLIPMTLSTAYAGVRLSVLCFRKRWWIGLIALCGLLVLGGDYIYDNINVSRAANRLHLPPQVIHVCDFLLEDTNGQRTKAAFPTELAQQVRQYTADIDLPFGREMLVQQWDYWNPVYEVMEKPVSVNAAALADACREAGCEYIVFSVNRGVEGDLAAEGFDIIGNVDGFNIYRNPEIHNKR